MWWPLWMASTLALIAAGHFAGDYPARNALIAILVGLLASRVAVNFVDKDIAMFAVWVCVAFYLFFAGKVWISLLCAFCAAAYFPVWASYLVADIFGVLMLVSAGGSIGGTLIGTYSDGPESGASGAVSRPVHSLSVSRD